MVVGWVCAQPTTDPIESRGGNSNPPSTSEGVKSKWSDFALECGWFDQNRPRWRNLTKTVHFRQNLTRSGENLLDLGRFPPNLVEISLDLVRSPQIPHKISLDLKYFDQKLAGKSLDHRILVSFMVRLVEAGFRGENPPTKLVSGICNPLLATGRQSSWAGYG